MSNVAFAEFAMGCIAAIFARRVHVGSGSEPVARRQPGGRQRRVRKQTYAERATIGRCRPLKANGLSDESVWSMQQTGH